ncbi:MAG TPA: metal ABC transporter permease [Acidimicrobiales bacterium]|nr:metal ABC transporter permease [Acidimicrobiales bacterium]
MMGGLFSLHFMVNALEAGTIVAVVAGPMGWFMVLRRQSFAGHTLAVVSFPGAAGAIWLGISPTFGYFAASVATAMVIAAVPRAAIGDRYSEESAVIGIVQAFALACGVLFVGLYGGFLNSLTALLFGTFLGISDWEVRVLLAVAVVVLVALAGMGRPLLFCSIDPAVASARGVPVRLVSGAFLILLGAAAAEASQITGALLVFALLVMPAATAQQLTPRPALGLVLSVVLGVTFAWGGLVVAYFTDYPVGFTVTSIGIVALAGATGGRALAESTRRIRTRPA